MKPVAPVTKYEATVSPTVLSNSRSLSERTLKARGIRGKERADERADRSS